MITTKQRLVIVLVLAIVLVSLIAFEVYRTIEIKNNYKEVCLQDAKRICICSEPGRDLFSLVETDK